MNRGGDRYGQLNTNIIKRITILKRVTSKEPMGQKIPFVPQTANKHEKIYSSPVDIRNKSARVK